MSSDAVGWAFRHSPFSGATFAVHLALADTANDQNDNMLWFSQGTLATKARVGKRSVQPALDTLLAAGFLEEFEGKPTGHGGRLLRKFRFIFREDALVVYESRYRERADSNAQPLRIPPPSNTQSAQSNTQTGAEQYAATAYKPKENPIKNPNTRAPIPVTRSFFDHDDYPSQSNVDMEALWVEAWNIYPRKTAKGASRKAFEHAARKLVGLQPEAPPSGPVLFAAQTILAGIKRYAHDPNLPRNGEQNFIPHMSTWLNQGRWDDEPLPPRQRPARDVLTGPGPAPR